MTSIICELHQCGIVQTGLFNNAPIHLNFHLLVSYPDLFDRLVEELVQHVDRNHTEKLLCDVQAIALSTLISQKTKIPLVYAQGRYETAAYDLIGAYDVGHPTALICNIWDHTSTSNDLISKAERGGLQLAQVVSILQFTSPDEAVNVSALWTIEQLVEALRVEKLINDHQARHIIQWSISRA